MARQPAMGGASHKPPDVKVTVHELPQPLPVFSLHCGPAGRARTSASASGLPLLGASPFCSSFFAAALLSFPTFLNHSNKRIRVRPSHIPPTLHPPPLLSGLASFVPHPRRRPYPFTLVEGTPTCHCQRGRLGPPSLLPPSGLQQAIAASSCCAPVRCHSGSWHR